MGEVSKSFILLGVWVIPNCSQGYFWLCAQGFLLVMCREPYLVLQIELGSPTSRPEDGMNQPSTALLVNISMPTSTEWSTLIMAVSRDGPTSLLLTVHANLTIE